MFNSSPIVLASSLLLLIALPVIRADLMCYVCDDCAQLPKDAPLLACNEDFFNPGGSTEASTVTTTSTTEASTTTTQETTAAPVETTTAITSAETDPPTTESTTTTVETTTTEQTTETTQSTQTTETPIPTPPTAGPVQTTTGVPTPPAEDLAALSVALNTTRLVPVDAGEETTTPSLAIRQRRAVINTEFTYHCYSVQVTVNGSMTTDRGCSRVSTFEGVCEQLKIQNNSTELANCNPCSMNACNGSSALQNSVLASLLLALVAFALQRN
ncbi:flocculation protein FLO11 [Drosophila eugracilis]|uniref:flocculation protein FLO11 n=1 Tax=Drosophila eugracilis TaxID=29029 RepID=UPI0007E66B9C|nr:flocculation protein FLO11 [Drosophila eugracilis]